MACETSTTTLLDENHIHCTNQVSTQCIPDISLLHQQMFSGVHTQPVGYKTDMIQCPECSHYGISLPGSVFRMIFLNNKVSAGLDPN